MKTKYITEKNGIADLASELQLKAFKSALMNANDK